MIDDARYMAPLHLAGRLILENGGETYRVEESVKRICGAYGLDARVYAIPHSLIITIMIPGDRPMTQLCRMDHLGTDLEAVEQYSNLSRRICAEKPDWEEALRWLDISLLAFSPVISVPFFAALFFLLKSRGRKTRHSKYTPKH